MAGVRADQQSGIAPQPIDVGMWMVEMARAYTTHPLPPSQDAERMLERVVALWQAMAHSYAAIAQADAGEGTLEDQRALLAQRRISEKDLREDILAQLIQALKAEIAIVTATIMKKPHSTASI